MRLKNTIIQLGIMAISTPLVILLFNYLALTIAPVFHPQEQINSISPDNLMQILKAGLVFQAFRIKFIYFGTIAGLIVGRAAYYMWKEQIANQGMDLTR